MSYIAATGSDGGAMVPRPVATGATSGTIPWWFKWALIFGVGFVIYRDFAKESRRKARKRIRDIDRKAPRYQVLGVFAGEHMEPRIFHTLAEAREYARTAKGPGLPPTITDTRTGRSVSMRKNPYRATSARAYERQVDLALARANKRYRTMRGKRHRARRLEIFQEEMLRVLRPRRTPKQKRHLAAKKGWVTRRLPYTSGWQPAPRSIRGEARRAQKRLGSKGSGGLAREYMRRHPIPKKRRPKRKGRR